MRTDTNTKNSPIRLLGVDFGTTNMKAVIVDEDGTILGIHREKIEYRTDSTGVCELPAAHFARALGRCISGVCAVAGCVAADIDSICYASQANTFLLIDGSGDPVSPIVSWQDTRVEHPADRIVELWRRDDFLETTGLGIFAPGLAAVKLADMIDDSSWRASWRVMTVSDYALFLFTGEYVGDSSTASMLGLFDVRRGVWWDDAVSALGLDISKLSSPRRPGTIAGSVDRNAASVFGFKTGVPVVAGGLDHYIAAIGAGADRLATACESTGTVVACVFTGTGIAPLPGGCFGPGVAGNYLLTFDDFGGTVLEGYRERTCPGRSFAELDRLAGAVAPGACGVVARIGEKGRLTFHDWPGTGLDSGEAHSQGIDARDRRIGCEVRAILESTAYRIKTIVDTAAGGTPESVVSTGGGAKSDIWTRIKASFLGSRFITVSAEEPAAYGAAFLAGMATGLVDAPGTGIPESWISVRSTVEPDPEQVEIYREISMRYEVS